MSSQVTCDAGYKEFRGGEPAREGKKECIANEFKCPTASMNGTQCFSARGCKLYSKGDRQAGGMGVVACSDAQFRGIDSDTQQPTQLFCCDEPLGMR